MIRILIADDHPIVRRGLRQIVGEQPDMTIRGEAANAAELLQQLRRQEYDVLVMDVSMPGRSGLDVLKEIRQQYSAMPVLILSAHPEDQFAIRALKAGAAGYLTKHSTPEELIQAIRKVHDGGRYVSALLAEKLAFAVASDADRPPHESLSDREYEVMRLIASGKSVSEIARDLSLSVKTISTYRTRVLGKMGMASNAMLTHYAIKHGLVGEYLPEPPNPE